jgi:hypothetical protein
MFVMCAVKPSANKGTCLNMKKFTLVRNFTSAMFVERAFLNRATFRSTLFYIQEVSPMCVVSVGKGSTNWATYTSTS